jgi:hypothetical protein
VEVPMDAQDVVRSMNALEDVAQGPSESPSESPSKYRKTRLFVDTDSNDAKDTIFPPRKTRLFVDTTDDAKDSIVPPRVLSPVPEYPAEAVTRRLSELISQAYHTSCESESSNSLFDDCLPLSLVKDIRKNIYLPIMDCEEIVNSLKKSRLSFTARQMIPIDSYLAPIIPDSRICIRKYINGTWVSCDGKFNDKSFITVGMNSINDIEVQANGSISRINAFFFFFENRINHQPVIIVVDAWSVFGTTLEEVDLTKKYTKSLARSSASSRKIIFGNFATFYTTFVATLGYDTPCGPAAKLSFSLKDTSLFS